jgi:hypothetical protein
MVDTINIKLGVEQVGNIDLLDIVPQFLQDVSEHTFEGGNVSITGKLKNLKVSVSPNSVSVKNGSLTKWYLGDNLKIMSRKDIEKAFEKLSDTLHLPINKAKVTRFDFGKNLMLEFNTSLYLPYFGSNGRYVRLEQSKGLNYKITDRALCFYDKIAEMKSKGDYIPPLYEGRNVIRYEKRYQSNVAKYFKREMIFAETLFEEQFYADLVADWYNDYLNIQKQKIFKLDMTSVSTKEQMKLMGVLSLVKELGGKLAALQDIKERQSKGLLNKNQAYDLRELIKQSQKLSLHHSENELIKELDKKMADAVMYCS